MNRTTFIAALFLTSMTWAHSDLRPRVENSKVVTDGYSDQDGTTQLNSRVFGYDFGENPDDPFFAQDPGFNSATGSGLPASSRLAFNLAGGLRFWNGTGEVAFSPVATGESLALSFGASVRTLTGANISQAGFNIQSIGAGGTVHRHLNAFLNGADGNSVPASPGRWGAGDGIQPANGIYIFSMELTVTPSAGIAGSDPIYIVFNNGLDEAAHEQAIGWVNENLVPEPGGLVGLAASSIFLARGRRRRMTS